MPSAALVSPPPILQFSLRDGTPVALRPVVPEDRERLVRGFEQLSEASRWFRFLGSVRSLSDAQLRYLTDTDSIDHVAWGALDLSHPDAPGFGVGRWIRLADEPAAAEFSLTVADNAQGRGVGQLLLAVLMVLAETLDVRTLRGVVSRENDRMGDWLRRLGADSTPDGTDIVFDVPVPLEATSGSARAFADLIDQIREAVRTQRPDVLRDA